MVHMKGHLATLAWTAEIVHVSEGLELLGGVHAAEQLVMSAQSDLKGSEFLVRHGPEDGRCLSTFTIPAEPCPNDFGETHLLWESGQPAIPSSSQL